MAWETSLFFLPLGDLFLQCVDFFILVTKNHSQFNKTLKKVSNLKYISTVYSVILLTCSRTGWALNYLSSHCYFAAFFFLPFPSLGMEPCMSKFHYLGFMKHHLCLLCKFAIRHKWLQFKHEWQRPMEANQQPRLRKRLWQQNQTAWQFLSDFQGFHNKWMFGGLCSDSVWKVSSKLKLDMCQFASSCAKTRTTR